MNSLRAILLVLCNTLFVGAAAAGGVDGDVYGAVKFASSCNNQAQQAFASARELLYKSTYAKTVSAFQSALEADPHCAMAYWGIAMAEWTNRPLRGPDRAGLRRALLAIAKGKQYAAAPREWELLGALEILFREDRASEGTRARRYAEAIEELQRKYPDDSGYSELGSWRQSVAANETALAAAKAYAVRHYPGVADAAEAQAYDSLEYAYLQLGKDREAKAVVREVAAIRKFNVHLPAVAVGVEAVRVRYALERNAWTEAAALQPINSPFPYAEAIVYFARAIGAARMKAIGQAGRDLRALHERQAACRWLRDRCARRIEILEKCAAAWLERARGNNERAQLLMREAARLDDAIDTSQLIDEPLLPVREQLADLLLELNQPGAALTEFERALRKTPRRLRSYYGAAKAAQRAGNAGEAARYFAELLALTRDADGERADLLEAKAFFGAVRTARIN